MKDQYNDDQSSKRCNVDAKYQKRLHAHPTSHAFHLDGNPSTQNEERKKIEMNKHAITTPQSPRKRLKQ